MQEFAFAAGVLALLVAAVLIGHALIRKRRLRLVSPDLARAMFVDQRAELERQFFEAAAATGKPRGLSWKSCEFGPDLQLARQRFTGELVALVDVTIAFEAIPGSDMEGLPAVGNLRSATAVFTWRQRWTTTGRAVFNLGPDEALRHFRTQYEPVEMAEENPT